MKQTREQTTKRIKNNQNTNYKRIQHNTNKTIKTKRIKNKRLNANKSEIHPYPGLGMSVFPGSVLIS